MAENTVVFVPKDGTIVFADSAGFAAGNANQYEVDYENGDFSTDLGNDLANLQGIPIFDRGIVVGYRCTSEEPRQITFNVHLRNFADSDDLNLPDVLYGTNAASGWASPAGTGYEGHFYDVKFTADASGVGADAEHGVIARNCHTIGCAPAEGEPGQMAVTVEVLGDIERFGDGVAAND